MADFSPYLSTADVAARKGCTRMAVRNAIERGELRAIRIGRAWAVADDGAMASWNVKETGGRTHRGDKAAGGLVE